MGAWCVLGFFFWSVVVVVSQRQEVLMLAMGWRDGMGLVRLGFAFSPSYLRGRARNGTKDVPCMAPYILAGITLFVPVEFET